MDKGSERRDGGKGRGKRRKKEWGGGCTKGRESWREGLTAVIKGAINAKAVDGIRQNSNNSCVGRIGGERNERLDLRKT